MMDKEEETLTATPKAARRAAPVCISALLSLVYVPSDSLPTQTYTAVSSARLALVEPQEGGIRWLGQAEGRQG